MVAVASAFYAAREARRARASEREAERLRLLKDRVAGRKYKLYRPMIEAWADVLAGKSKLTGDELAALGYSFSRWLAIFGSDDAVIAFRNMMTTGFQVSKLPPTIPVRMYLK